MVLAVLESKCGRIQWAEDTQKLITSAEEQYLQARYVSVRSKYF